MNTTAFVAALLPLCAITHAIAQVQVPVNPRATFLHINNDPNALPAPAIPLTALGVAPGQWVEITTVGAYAISANDSYRNLICVFSSSPTLLAPTATNRVQGAIAAGPEVVSGNTNNGNQATDIDQDFLVTRHSWTNGTKVKVPAGATHIFLSVLNHNSNLTYFSNNTDPNNDFFAVFTPSAPATLQGTAEHAELRTGINGTSTALPDVKPANAFSTLSVDVAQKWGGSTGEVFLVGATIFPTGGTPPAGPLPDVHMGSNFVVVQVGVMTTAPGLWSFFVPPGNAGTTIVVQGFFLSNYARNGLLMSTDAHRIELQ